MQCNHQQFRNYWMIEAQVFLSLYSRVGNLLQRLGRKPHPNFTKWAENHGLIDRLKKRSNNVVVVLYVDHADLQCDHHAGKESRKDAKVLRETIKRV